MILLLVACVAVPVLIWFCWWVSGRIDDARKWEDWGEGKRK